MVKRNKTICIDADVFEYLNTKRSASGFIEELVRVKMSEEHWVPKEKKFPLMGGEGSGN